ncbi:MAG: hypothetical protein ABWX84_05525, partial [Nocardioides sp.]
MSSLRDRLARIQAGEPEGAAPVNAAVNTPGDTVPPAPESVAVTATLPALPPAAPSEEPPVSTFDLATRRAVAAAGGPGDSGPDASIGRRRALAATHAQGRIEELKSTVHTELLKQLGPQLYDANIDQEDLAARVRQVLKEVIGAQERPLSSADRTQVTLEITDDILGYGPIEPFLRDPDVTEVMVNGPRQIYLERRGKLTLADAYFTDESHLRRTIDKIVSRIGRRVDESSPMVDAR